MENGRSSYKDAINYGRTHKNAGEYCENIKNIISHCLFYENEKNSDFCAKKAIQHQICNILNCIYKITMLKSKSQSEVCFFCCVDRCRSPPVSDLNLPLKNKFESEEYL